MTAETSFTDCKDYIQYIEQALQVNFGISYNDQDHCFAFLTYLRTFSYILENDFIFSKRNTGAHLRYGLGLYIQALKVLSGTEQQQDSGD